MLYDLTVVQFIKMLGNLNLMLDKSAAYAETKRINVEVLLNSRLAPDQFHLIKQIQIACDTAKLGVSRLTGKPAPVHADDETTLEQLKTRINEVIAYLKTFTAEDFTSAEDRQISQPRWEGKYLNGVEFALQHAVPNIYFHITVAYSILRHNGVELGKKDFLGPMPYKVQ
jgi:hypothetical protein